MSYAQRTKVTVDASASEIEKLLKKAGADKFARTWDESGATIMFGLAKRHVRFHLPLPRVGEKLRGSKVPLTENQVAQETRRRWRALVIILKAKLEGVNSGITSFEEEFLAYIVVNNGQTMMQWSGQWLREAYENGRNMPPLLPPAKP